MTPWMDANFTKRFPGISVHGAFTWHDRPRRVTALFGPSGCGKTTILRCLAGLERPDLGHIRAFDEQWCDASCGVHLAPQRRRVGFLFQDYMLFPHLSVVDNIGFGVAEKTQRKGAVEKLLERFQLTGLGQRRPRELSGGQQQRVALARVLAARPRLLCLDEPLSALDGPTRIELQLALRDWIREERLPAIIVSHDAAEVQALAEDVIVLDQGQACQTGSVAEVWHRPVNATVARIVGFDNLLPATIVIGDLNSTPAGVTVAAAGPWQIEGQKTMHTVPAAGVMVCFRAEDVRCQRAGLTEPASVFTTLATILELVPDRGMWRLHLRLPSGPRVQAVVTRDVVSSLGLQPNLPVQLSIAPGAAVIVPA